MLFWALVAGALSGCSPTTNQADGPVGRSGRLTTSAQEATQRLAAALGVVASEVDVQTLRTRCYAEIQDCVDYALVSVARGPNRKIAVRVSTGQQTSLQEVQEDIRAVTRAQNGVLGPILAERLRTGALAPTENVLVWLPSGPPAVPKPNAFSTLAEAYSFAVAARAARQAAMLPMVQLATKQIEAAGGTVTFSDPNMPVLRAKVPGATIVELAARSGISRVMSDPDTPRETLTHYTYLYDADDHETLETFTSPYPRWRGSGVRVGLYEAGGCGAWSGPYTLPSAFGDWGGYVQNQPPVVYNCASSADGVPCTGSCGNGGGYCQQGKCVKVHKTSMAGLIGARHPSGEVRSAAEMTLYDAMANRIVAINWLDTNDVRLINDSETIGYADSVNDAIRNKWITVVKAAGNEPFEKPSAPVDCYVNSLCVGNMHNNGGASWVDWWKTDPDNQFGIYAMSVDDSSWVDDPAHFDAEKPDVVSIGGAGTNSPYTTWPTPTYQGEAYWDNDYDGTSGAAATTTGLVAVLQQYAPTLVSWPELLRPLMMASALHNIHGNFLSRNGDAVGDTDEHDGAGAPKASVAKTIIDNSWFRTLNLGTGSFGPYSSYQKAHVVTSITLEPAQSLRVVLGWMFCVDPSATPTTFLAADLDLHLFLGQTEMDSSRSYSNSLEMLEYTNNTTSNKTMTVVITYYGPWKSCLGGTNEYAGIAWVRHVGGTPMP